MTFDEVLEHVIWACGAPVTSQEAYELLAPRCTTGDLQEAKALRHDLER